MTDEQRRAITEELLAMTPQPSAPRYYKTVEDGIITAFGVGAGGTEIDEKQYAALQAAVGNRPVPPEGYGYRLKADLTWVLSALPEPEESELDPAEALELICGSRSLTRTQALTFRADIRSAELARAGDSTKPSRSGDAG